MSMDNGYVVAKEEKTDKWVIAYYCGDSVSYMAGKYDSMGAACEEIGTKSWNTEYGISISPNLAENLAEVK